MSFLAKTDYYGLSTGSGSKFVIVSSDENKSASTATAQDEKGDIIAEEVYGETSAPSCNYVLSGDATLSGIDMGNPITTGGKNYVITSIGIDTQAGSPPSITVSGEEVPANSHCSSDCYYDAPTASIECCHHAQILFSAFTLSGQGAYLTGANYSIECELTKATKDGDTVCYDITGGKVTVSLTIQGTGGSTAPTVTPGTNWKITSPVTQSNPDSGYETYTCTLTMNMSHHSAA